MFAVSFVAGLADAFVGLHGVLADGVDAAVVEPLCTLVHIYTQRTHTRKAFVNELSSLSASFNLCRV